ncbi:zinc finger protein [Macleaya cordata]|uniref:Zinc finger protein n=1 Tax=Macleaya cordata TaxID=56857 RepID=A0A200R1R4_MACCD|nr:zinc finger protein [Macleaya cordata]
MIEEMAPLRSTGFVDPGWEHGIAQDERKKKVKCNYCEKVVSGGIYRLKQHLARISGEVTYCKKAPEEVYLKMKENLEGCRSNKKQRQSEDEEQASLDLHSNDDDEEEEVSVGYKSKGKQVIGDKSVVISLAPLRSLGYVDPGWEHGIAQDDRKKKENMKWHRTGRRNRRPEANEIATFYMHSDNEVEEEQEEGLVHGRGKEKQLVTVDNSFGREIRKRFGGRSPGSITEPQFKRLRLDSVIQKTPKSHTMPSYKQVKVKTGNDKKSRKEVISAICKFFYHAALPLQAASSPYFHKMLELVGEYGQGLKGPSSQLMLYVRNSVDSILQVLQKADTDEGLSMPSIYNDMYRAKLAIKAIHGDDLRKYGPFWSVIDNHWSSLFHHPLYVAAYFLNPSYRYRPDFVAHPEVIRGLNECIVRLEPDNGRRISASMQISDFVSAKADFGTELAVSTRMELDPAAWWQQHGINCLELQRIAIRILSQTCSSFGCQHNWSTYDQIHSKRRNRLARKRLNDLIYVHYNLRLKERQLRRKTDNSDSLDSFLLESLLDDWIVETENRSLEEDEEILYNEMEEAEPYENELNENEDGNAEARNNHMELVKLADVVEPLEVHRANTVAATDDDDDLDFLDDDLTD